MLKKLGCLVLALILVAGISLFFAWSTILTAVVQEALSTARTNGARIAWGKVTAAGTAVDIKAFEIWLPGPAVGPGFRPPIQLEFSNASGALPLSSLVSLAPRADWSLNGYGGTIKGDASSFTSVPTGSIIAEGVNIALHPQLRALGLASAVLSGTAKEVTFAPFPATKAEFAVQVSGLSIPTFPEQFALLKLPPIEDGAITVEGTIKGGVVDARSVRASSNVLTADGQFRFTQPLAGGKSTCEGKLSVSLTERGMKALGPWLPLISNSALSADTRTFEVRITGVQCTSSTREPRVGNMCIVTRYQRTV
jgi:hypothetical protein